MEDVEVAIVGAGIGGLTLALSLQQIGITARVFEAVPEIRPLGAGINLLPHAVRELDELGLVPALDAAGIRTKDASYFNQHGQLIYTEPAGEAAGYAWPQFSIHRGDVQLLLLDEVRRRLGADAVVTGRRCTAVTVEDGGASAHFVDADGSPAESVRARVVVGCDGISSAIRKQFYPDEGRPVYSGLTIWRGVTPFKPFLSGADTIRAGWMTCGKLMAYPIRDAINDQGDQLVNWVATLERPRPDHYNWNREGSLSEFFEPYADWHFDWLDVPALLRQTDPVLVFPMVDRDPVATWTFGSVTLLGDAAHPMYPRGSNGAGQAILDARYLTGCFKRHGVGLDALAEYDRVRVEQTGDVVLMNRANPPDAILREVYERTGGRPFDSIDDVISRSELAKIADDYRAVAGFDAEQLRKRPSLV
ncbi:flavin-dependent oxidoreductase [Streptosporangium sp. NPDC051022]|uniref:flavin-dependent oxidoreductase n=1 Tax=Streptosporangium sp. NPDC051022 TaxID=3155752 RepID=UPI00342C646C